MSTNASAVRRGITATGAPPAVGPYTHAVRHGGLLSPARVAVGIAALPKNARVEIDAIVAVS